MIKCTYVDEDSGAELWSGMRTDLPIEGREILCENTGLWQGGRLVTVVRIRELHTDSPNHLEAQAAVFRGEVFTAYLRGAIVYVRDIPKPAKQAPSR